METSWITFVTSLWTTYNTTQDGFLPFLLPLGLWSGAYIYCLVYNNPNRDAFSRWHRIHNVHNIGAIVLGTGSILSGTTWEIVFMNERIPILWSLSYFAIDCIDCTMRQDWTYLFHCVCCGLLGLANYNTPILRQLKMNSKATYCELSNPFMHWAKRTRDPKVFALFALVYTCCRIIWLPILYHQLLQAKMKFNHPVMIVLQGFYGLNCWWYYKILKLLYLGWMGKVNDVKKGD